MSAAEAFGDRPSLVDRLAEAHRRTRPASVALFGYAGFVVVLVVAGGLIGLVAPLEVEALTARLERVALPVEALLFLGSAVLFVRWKLAAYRLLPDLTGAAETEYPPAWAGWAYVVPILNLFRPYQIMREIWDDSEPARRALDPEAEAGGAGLVTAWWTCWILGNLTAQVGRLAGRSAAPNDLAVSYILIAAAVLTAGAGLLAALVVRAADARQQARGAEILAGDTLLSLPTS